MILGLVTLVLALLLGWVGALLGLSSGSSVCSGSKALTEAVADVRDGRADLSIGDTFRRVQPRLWSIVGAGILAGLDPRRFILIIPGLILTTFWCLIARDRARRKAGDGVVRPQPPARHRQRLERLRGDPPHP